MSVLLTSTTREPPLALLAVIFGIGVLMLRYPAIIWELAQIWKTDGDAKPSGLYVAYTRIGALWVLLISGTGLFVKLWHFLEFIYERTL